MPRLRFAAVTLLLLAGAGGAYLASTQKGKWESPAPRALALGRDLAAAGARAGRFALDTVRQGQQRAPAVVIGLGMIVLVPLLAFATAVLRGTRDVAHSADSSRSERTGTALDQPAARAWIDVDGPRRRHLALSGELLRIGRDEENDLRLEDPNVHRHHALIQRTPEAEFILLDVSGAHGNGTIVNGRRSARTRLKDGDLIELGNSRVRFHRGAMMRI